MPSDVRQALAGAPARTRPTSSATSGWSATACSLDVQYAHVGNNFILGFHDRRAARRPADADRLHRPERPLGRAERVHPPGQQRQRQRELLHAGGWAATTRSSSAATGAMRLSDPINHTGGYATARFPTRRRLAITDATAQRRGGCAVDLTRDGYSADDLTNTRSTRRTRSRTAARRCSSASATTTTTTGARARHRRRTRSCPGLLPARARFGGVDPGIVVQQLLAASRPHLRPDGQRQDARARELRALLRTGRHRRRGRPDQSAGSTTRALSVGRPERRQGRPGRTKSRSSAELREAPASAATGTPANPARSRRRTRSIRT